MVSENKKIGLFGGSFNPIQKSHLEVIDAVLEDKIVDEIWIVPCRNHAFGKKMVDFDKRVKMIKLALGDRKSIRVSDVENKSEGKSYTLKTLEKLQRENPGLKFFLIIGSDIIKEIHRWYNYAEILKKTSFIILERPGHLVTKLVGMKIERILWNKTSAYSSAKVRKFLHLNKPIKELVTKEVGDYIRGKRLYA